MNVSRRDALLLPILSSKLLNECLLISWMLSLRAMAKSASAHRWPHLSSHCCGRQRGREEEGEKKRERRRGREEEGRRVRDAAVTSAAWRRILHLQVYWLWLQRLVLPLHLSSLSHLLYLWGHLWCDGTTLELPPQSVTQVECSSSGAKRGSAGGPGKSLFPSECLWASNCPVLISENVISWETTVQLLCDSPEYIEVWRPGSLWPTFFTHNVFYFVFPAVFVATEPNPNSNLTRT